MAKCLENCFASDGLVKMVQTVSQNKMRLLVFLEALLEASDSDVEKPLEEMPSELQTVVEKIRAISKGLVCMLSPIPGHRGSSVKDASNLMSMKALRGISETVLVSVIQKQKEFGQMWDEVLSKGVATLDSSSEISQMIADIEEQLSQDGLGEDTLKVVIHRHSELKKSTRAGALAGLESSMKNALHSEAEKFLQELASGQVSRTLTFLELVIKGLAIFNDATSLSWTSKLEKSKGKALSQMILLDLEAHLKEYDQVEDPSSKKTVAGEALTKLVDLLKKSKSNKDKDLELSSSAKRGISRAVFWHFRSFFLELRETCLLGVGFKLYCKP